MFKMILRITCLISALVLPAFSVNFEYQPDWSSDQLQYYLNNPVAATSARYGLHDDAGNSMDCMSIIQLPNQAYKYAGVYHTGYNVGNNVYRYKVNLALSNNLLDWTYQGVLIDNADMPRIARVQGSDWLVVTHEQWQGSGPGSRPPARVAFELFYTADDLVNRKIAGTRIMPKWQNDLNGTPSIYEFHLSQYNGWYSVDGQYGFHFWNGQRDVNGVTTISKLFDPTTDPIYQPSTANAYNNRFISAGVSGNIGQRDTFITSTQRFNIQEGNIGKAGGSWDKWRVWLWQFGEAYNYPTGNGVLTALNPQTPGGSVSFGNPGITIVDSPSGSGKAVVVSYFLFGEGAAPGEGGSLLYYFDF